MRGHFSMSYFSLIAEKNFWYPVDFRLFLGRLGHGTHIVGPQLLMTNRLCRSNGLLEVLVNLILALRLPTPPSFIRAHVGDGFPHCASALLRVRLRTDALLADESSTTALLRCTLCSFQVLNPIHALLH